MKITIGAFILLMIAQWLVPAQMIFKSEHALTAGKAYKFETAPVDPEDPVRGRYIVLSFKDNHFLVKGKTDFMNQEKVYVEFIADEEGFAQISKISKQKPQTDYYLQTYISSVSVEGDSSHIYLYYPFTRFYMDEYNAPEAEKIYRSRTPDTINHTYALVDLYRGTAVIDDVFVNDRSLKSTFSKKQNAKIPD